MVFSTVLIASTTHAVIILLPAVVAAAIIGMILLNIGLGVASQPVIKVIEAGLAMFG